MQGEREEAGQPRKTPAKHAAHARLRCLERFQFNSLHAQGRYCPVSPQDGKERVNHLLVAGVEKSPRELVVQATPLDFGVAVDTMTVSVPGPESAQRELPSAPAAESSGQPEREPMTKAVSKAHAWLRKEMEIEHCHSRWRDQFLLYRSTIAGAAVICVLIFVCVWLILALVQNPAAWQLIVIVSLGLSLLAYCFAASTNAPEPRSLERNIGLRDERYGLCNLFVLDELARSESMDDNQRQIYERLLRRDETRPFPTDETTGDVMARETCMKQSSAPLLLLSNLSAKLPFRLTLRKSRPEKK